MFPAWAMRCCRRQHCVRLDAGPSLVTCSIWCSRSERGNNPESTEYGVACALCRGPIVPSIYVRSAPLVAHACCSVQAPERPAHETKS